MRLIILTALFGLGTATAAEREFVPTALDGQEVRYERGAAYAIAYTQSARVTITVSPIDKRSVFLVLGVANTGTEPFTVSDESVSAYSSSGEVVAMTYAERVRALKREEMWAGIATGLAAAANNINASNAGYQNHSGTYRSSSTATAYGSGGYAYGNSSTYGSYSGTTYNAAAASVAQSHANAENRALFDRQSEVAQYARLSLDERALRANTIDPGNTVVGDVKVRLPRRSRKEPLVFNVDVKVGEDTVSFLLNEVPR